MPPSYPHLFILPVLRQILEDLLPSLSLDLGLEALLGAHNLGCVPGHRPVALDMPRPAELPSELSALACVLECQAGGFGEGRCGKQVRMYQAGLHSLSAWKPPVNHGAQLRVPGAGVRRERGAVMWAETGLGLRPGGGSSREAAFNSG